mgnify:CR=1 FL=1
MQFTTITDSLRRTTESSRHLIDATVDQLSDKELHRRPSPETNSVAVLLRHLGGNLKSRWTDFLTTDGEKPNRDRDREFHDWDGDRQSLCDYFDTGWKIFQEAIDQVNESNIESFILIRGEKQSVLDALLRSVTHVTYHAGQITMTARLVHEGPWHWLTIAPGKSKQHNESTWGTSQSRSVFGRGGR